MTHFTESVTEQAALAKPEGLESTLRSAAGCCHSEPAGAAGEAPP